LTQAIASVRTFRNPLHHRPFADPFVLKHNGQYYAYGTPASGGLPVLHSTDLVTWEEAGEVLDAPRPGSAHWAPEVAYDNGRFVLYYSSGGPEGEHQQLRMASGSSPSGPFDHDLGLLDPDDPFTIDAHPFRDDDGEWYLFYSRDFLDGDYVGTGIVVDRLVDMTRLAGERETVMRPQAEWHLYERQRRWYDGVWDWYTVEGPFVRKHDGRYWCFYSGGAWKAENYGISSAVSDHPMGPYQPVVSGDTADVLRTVPGKVIGPGHGSAVVGPDNVTEYLAYHAWDIDHTGRFLHLDRLLWDGGRPVSPGPRTDPQPTPAEPFLRDFVGRPSCQGAPRWRLERPWTATVHELRHHGGASPATATLDGPAPRSFLFEVNLALAATAGGTPSYGVTTAYGDDRNHAVVSIDPHRSELRWRVLRHGDVQEEGVLGSLRRDFSAQAYHQLVLRQGPDEVAVTLDGVTMGSYPAAPPASGASVGVWTNGAPLSAVGVALTELPRAAEPNRG
jgi:GH43 family beta-xylosidase